MKPLDNFFSRNIKNNPNKKITPIVLVGNIYKSQDDEPGSEGHYEYGIRNPNITQDDKDIIGQYQDFDENYIVAFGPVGGRLKFFSKDFYSSDEEIIYDNLDIIPALQNSPKISESVDLRSKKVKVNTSTASLTNCNIRDRELSDLFNDFNLLGMEVRVLWVNLDMKTEEGHPIPIQMENLCKKSAQINDLINSHSNATQMFYGTMHSLNQTKDSIILKIEDASFSLFSLEIPRARLGDEDEIQDRYKLQPIPMVYGEVEKSPLVLSDNDLDDDEFYLLADDTFNQDRNFTIQCDPGQVFLGNDKKTFFHIPRLSTLRVKRKLDEEVYEEFEYTDAIQIITNTGIDGEIGEYFAIGSEHYGEDEVSPNPYSDGILHINVIRTPKKVVLEDSNMIVPIPYNEVDTTDDGINDGLTLVHCNGDSVGHTIIDKLASYDKNRGTYSLMPNTPETAIQSVRFLSNLRWFGPGLSETRINSSYKVGGYPKYFLNDGSGSNPHPNKMVDDFKTSVEEGNGSYGFVQGRGGLFNFRDLVAHNPELIPDDIRQSWESTTITEDNYDIGEDIFTQDVLDWLYNEWETEWPDWESFYNDLIGSENDDIDEADLKAGGASLSIEDCIGSGQIGKSGFGFWGVNEDAIRDLAENDSLTQGDMLSTLIGSGGLFEEHFGAHKEPAYYQHFENAVWHIWNS